MSERVSPTVGHAVAGRFDEHEERNATPEGLGELLEARDGDVQAHGA
jgi:hypothetical protein